MGCSSCGGQKKTGNIKSAPFLDQNNKVVAKSIQAARQQLHQHPNKAQPKIIGVTSESFSQLQQINIPTNLAQHSQNGKYIYLVAGSLTLASTIYMLRLLQKISLNLGNDSLKIFYMSREFMTDKGLSFQHNPTIYFFKNGKIQCQIGGIFQKIEHTIQSFIS